MESSSNSRHNTDAIPARNIAGMAIVRHLHFFPHVPMEAAAPRKLVLSLASDDGPEELTRPDCLRLARIGDIDAPVPHANELLEGPQLRKRIGDSAREETRSKVSLQQRLAAVDSLCQDVVGREN